MDADDLLREETHQVRHNLRLYVAGTAPISARAITNLNTLLDKHLAGSYQLEIIDVHQQPELAQRDDITAVPVLLKLAPLPYRLLIGDMSDEKRVLSGLGIK